MRRFDALQLATGAPRAVLADRLRRLADADVLFPRAYRLPGSRTRVEYVLTEAGVDLLPVLAAISDWAARHLPGEASSTSSTTTRPAAGGSPRNSHVSADRTSARTTGWWPRSTAKTLSLVHGLVDRLIHQRRFRCLSPVTTDATFGQDVLASPTPVLVDFTANWCPPCRMIAPALDQIAADEAGRVKIVSLDVDANPETTRRYNVIACRRSHCSSTARSCRRQLEHARALRSFARLEPHLTANV